MRGVTIASVLAVVLAIPALAQAPSPAQRDTPVGNVTPEDSPTVANCPPASAHQTQAGTTGSSTSMEKPSTQPVERSIILPNADGHQQSAAPSVQQDGQSVVARSDGCPKPPNRLDATKSQ